MCIFYVWHIKGSCHRFALHCCLLPWCTGQVNTLQNPKDTVKHVRFERWTYWFIYVYIMFIYHWKYYLSFLVYVSMFFFTMRILLWNSLRINQWKMKWILGVVCPCCENTWADKLQTLVIQQKLFWSVALRPTSSTLRFPCSLHCNRL